MSGIAGLWSADDVLRQSPSSLTEMARELGAEGEKSRILAPGDNFYLCCASSPDNRTVKCYSEGPFDFLLLGNVYRKSSGLHDDFEGLGKLARESLVRFAEEIDGSFVMAIFDKERKALALLRDRLGTRPLFYTKKRNHFVFATSIRPILKSGFWKCGVNLEALDRFLSYGYVPNPETPFEGIFQAKPGVCLILEKGFLREKRYWEFRDYLCNGERLQGEKAVPVFAQAIENALAVRLKAHPEAGLFLSGGLDTSIVAAVAKKLTGGEIRAFSIGFEEKAYDETEDARAVADHLGLEFHSEKVRFGPDFPGLLEKIVFYHETPFGDTSAIPSYYAARLAKEHVDTVLTGDFPDQLIGGSGHQVAALARSANDPFYKRCMRNGVLRSTVARMPWKTNGSRFSDKIKRFVYRESFSLEEQRILLNMPVPPLLKRALYSPDMLDANRKSDPMEIARTLYGQVPGQSLLNKILFFDIHSYAPDDLMVKVDRMTRAHFLNAVSPYHDRNVVELVACLPDELKIGPDWERKVVMRRAFGHLLPERTLKKKKQGFAMPIGEWLVKNLREYVREILLDGRTLRRGYFNPEFLGRMLASFFSGESDYASGSESTVISLLTMELWHRRFIDG